MQTLRLQDPFAFLFASCFSFKPCHCFSHFCPQMLRGGTGFAPPPHGQFSTSALPFLGKERPNNCHKDGADVTQPVAAAFIAHIGHRGKLVFLGLGAAASVFQHGLFAAGVLFQPGCSARSCCLTLRGVHCPLSSKCFLLAIAKHLKAYLLSYHSS